jgi:hypothetical protein
VIKLYRCVQTDPPTRDDFVSPEAKGQPPRKNDPLYERTNSGLSSFVDWELLRDKARLFPKLGSFMVELVIPSHAPVIFERTFESFGHYTIWGDPDYLLTLVSEIRPVRPSESEQE